MKKLLSFLPTHFTICLIVGIVLQFHYKLWLFTNLQSCLVFLILVFILLLFNYFKKIILFTVSSWVLFVLIGMFVVFSQDLSKRENYYTTLHSADSIITFKVDKIVKDNLYYDKYQGSILKVGTYKTVGAIILNVQKDSLQKTATVGNVFLFKSAFIEVKKPLNPYQFDYKNYLEKQGIYHQVFLRNTAFLIGDSKHNSIYSIAESIRNKIEVSLLENDIKGEELAVIKALLLGQRSDISKELLEDYTRAGAIHILAVSGLHIGIILLILMSLFNPLERFKNGKTIKIILVLLFLWSFAIIAGLSASVVRAVTMFTAVAIGMTFQRKTMVLHSLITSMFVLLLVKPMFLFDVGFQLSYVAVGSIVTIQPIISAVWKPKWKIIDKIWQLSTVSVAAQIGVLPLSLFYFHQFPGLFILSNLVIIPFLGTLLMGGILVIFLSLLSVLPTFLAEVYVFVISLMNRFVSWISIQETFLINDIAFSGLLLVIFYMCLLFFFHFYEKKSFRSIIAFLLVVFLFQISLFYEKKQMETTNELIIFNKSRHTVVGENQNGNLKIYHDLDSISILNTNFINDYNRAKEIKKLTFRNQLPTVFKFKKEVLLVVDSLGVYMIKEAQNSTILLIQSPKINLERLIKEMQPKLIIADASNYKSQVFNWKLICDTKGIPFWDTVENGAFILK